LESLQDLLVEDVSIQHVSELLAYEGRVSWVLWDQIQCQQGDVRETLSSWVVPELPVSGKVCFRSVLSVDGACIDGQRHSGRQTHGNHAAQAQGQLERIKVCFVVELISIVQIPTHSGCPDCSGSGAGCDAGRAPQVQVEVTVRTTHMLPMSHHLVDLLEHGSFEITMATALLEASAILA
jgi:hypothetical protein